MKNYLPTPFCQRSLRSTPWEKTRVALKLIDTYFGFASDSIYYTYSKSRNNNMMEQCLKSYAWNHVQTDIREACNSNLDDNSKQTKSVWGKQDIVLKVSYFKMGIFKSLFHHIYSRGVVRDSNPSVTKPGFCVGSGGFL